MSRSFQANKRKAAFLKEGGALHMCTGRKRIPGRGGRHPGGCRPCREHGCSQTPELHFAGEREWGSRKMGRGPSNLLGAVVLEGQSTKRD